MFDLIEQYKDNNGNNNMQIIIVNKRYIKEYI